MTSKPAKYYSSFTVANIHFTVITSTSGIKEIIFNLEKNNSKLVNTIQLQPEDPAMHNVYPQLKEYFRGERKCFDLPLDIEGTEFQKKVWDELIKIPFGTTISYKELAVRLGDEKVIRAAASANGANPLPIVIPCHRVIGSDGSLVGYGGGLKIKEKLLDLEGSRQRDLFNF
ncbi:MAG: methylated-DNA--[protein]-cysteine S-methyltransferase [Bacteroidetes bacterium]|nr:methylated-DNA--[protein]-cysteine S-methyltransferase [Bacteroidota bacterium]